MLLENKKNNEKLIFSILILTVFALELIFFREIIFNNDNITGSLADARLVSLIMEHWYDVFFNNASLRDLSIFYPVKNTLGYSDTVFLLSIPYLFFRLIGMEWLTAYQLTLIFVHFFGGLCLAWFLRKNLKLPLFACIIGLIIGYYNISYYIKIQHTQFLTFAFIPLLFILLKYFYDNIINNIKRKRVIYGLLSIFLFSGILITSFYTGFYMALFFLIFNVVLVIIYFKNNNLNIKTIKNIFIINKLEIIIYFVCFVISLLPFIYIYLPIFKEMGSRNYGEVDYYLPNLYNYVNLQSLDKLFSIKPFIYELKYGYPLFTFIFLILSIIYFIKHFNKNKTTRNNIEIITICFAITIIIISVLMLKIELFEKNYSLWYFIYKLIPGASAIRAVFRFNQFLFLPAGILIAVYLSNKIIIPVNELGVKKISNNFSYAMIFIILTTFIFIDNQTNEKNTNWTKSYIYNYLDKVSSPPEDCESFLLINNPNEHYGYYHLDAWSIANKYNIKTINGYSGQFPDDWSYMFYMGENKNYSEVSKWINKHNLKNVYLYDYNNNIWTNYSYNYILNNSLQEYFIGENISLKNNRSIYQASGWSSSEEWGTWTEGEETVLAMKINSNSDLILIMNILFLFNHNPVDVYILDTLIGSFNFNIGENKIIIPKEHYDDNKLVIRLKFHDIKSPMDLNMSDDNRKLGMGIVSFNIIESN